MLLSCDLQDACMALTLVNQSFGSRNLSVPSPALAGTLEVRLTVSSYLIGAIAPLMYVPSAGSTLCRCQGTRTLVRSLPAPPSQPQARAGIDTGSPLFIGLLSAVSALVAAGIAAGVVARKRGLSGARTGQGITRPLRRPTTNASHDSAAGDTAATAAATAASAATAAAMATGPAATVAARRKAVITPIDGVAGNAPSQPSPHPASERTPTGARRV